MKDMLLAATLSSQAAAKLLFYNHLAQLCPVLFERDVGRKPFEVVLRKLFVEL